MPPLKTATSAPDPGPDPRPNPAPNRRRATFTAVELAHFLNISRATVWRMHSAGKLPSPVRLNRAVRWDCWIIEEWLDKGAPPRDKWEELQRP